MNILFDVVENLTYLMHPDDKDNRTGGDSYKFGTKDIRGAVMFRVIAHLVHNGHKVIVRNCISDVWHIKQSGVNVLHNFGAIPLEWQSLEMQDELLDEVDLYITCGFMSSRKGKNKEVRKKLTNQSGGRSAIFKYYDIGWIPDTVWQDSQGLFGVSGYCEGIDEQAEKIYNRIEAENFRKKILTSSVLTSKRPQPAQYETQKMLDSKGLRGKFIYMPAQKIKDGSITGIGFGIPKQSQYDVMPTLVKVAEAAAPHGIPIVIKPHPHWQCAWKDTPRISKVADELNKKWGHMYTGPGKFIKILEGNTQTFMRNAMFSTSICSASIIDSILTQTPTVYTGRTMFYKSKCMKYNPDIYSAIDDMICGKYDKKEMKLYQSMMLHYLNKTSLHKSHHSSENFRRFQRQIGINLC
jgi:hypothetical protein